MALDFTLFISGCSDLDSAIIHELFAILPFTMYDLFDYFDYCAIYVH